MAASGATTKGTNKSGVVLDMHQGHVKYQLPGAC